MRVKIQNTLLEPQLYLPYTSCLRLPRRSLFLLLLHGIVIETWMNNKAIYYKNIGLRVQLKLQARASRRTLHWDEPFRHEHFFSFRTFRRSHSRGRAALAAVSKPVYTCITVAFTTSQKAATTMSPGQVLAVHNVTSIARDCFANQLWVTVVRVFWTLLLFWLFWTQPLQMCEPAFRLKGTCNDIGYECYLFYISLKALVRQKYALTESSDQEASLSPRNFKDKSAHFL